MQRPNKRIIHKDRQVSRANPRLQELLKRRRGKRPLRSSLHPAGSQDRSSSPANRKMPDNNKSKIKVKAKDNIPDRSIPASKAKAEDNINKDTRAGKTTVSISVRTSKANSKDPDSRTVPAEAAKAARETIATAVRKAEDIRIVVLAEAARVEADNNSVPVEAVRAVADNNTVPAEADKAEADKAEASSATLTATAARRAVSRTAVRSKRAAARVRTARFRHRLRRSRSRKAAAMRTATATMSSVPITGATLATRVKIRTTVNSWRKKLSLPAR